MSKNFEIERKFLIAMPDVDALCQLPGAQLDEIVQTYLRSADGVTARVRRRKSCAGTVYTATEKRRVSDVTAIEDERAITEAEYKALLDTADPNLHPIEKRRLTIPYGDLLLEIDIYPFWQKTAILEIELAGEDTPFEIPPYLTVIREVSGDRRYKNVSLARSIPPEQNGSAE